MAALSIGRAWEESRDAIAGRGQLIWPVAMALVLVPATLLGLAMPGTAEPGAAATSASQMLLTLAVMLVMMVGQMTLVLLVDGWRESLGAAIGAATRRLPVLIAAAFIIALPAGFLAVALLAMLGLATGGDGQIAWQALSPAGSLALVAILIALLWIGVRLLPLMPVVATERLGPIASLRRAFALTRGHTIRLLGFLLLFLVAFLVVAMASAAVAGVIVKLLFGTIEPWSIGALITALIGGVVQAAVVTIYSAMLARITVQLQAAPEA